MNLCPWDFVDRESGATRPEAQAAEALLLRALRLAPRHELALHLHVHLAEVGDGTAAAGAAEAGRGGEEGGPAGVQGGISCCTTVLVAMGGSKRALLPSGCLFGMAPVLPRSSNP